MDEQILSFRSSFVWVVPEWLITITLILLFYTLGTGPLLNGIQKLHAIDPYLSFIIFLFPFVLFIWPIWKTLVTLLTLHIVTNERIKQRTGVLTAWWEEVEISRIRDFEIHYPWWLRPFGIGHLYVHSADLSMPVLPLVAIKNPDTLRDIIRQIVKERQELVGYREVEVT